MDNTQDIFDNQDLDAAVSVPEVPEGADDGLGDNDTPDTVAELISLRTEIGALKEQLAALVAEQKRAEVNKRNAEISAGRISGHGGEYFTPDEVRAMSQSEVRANYKKIKASMAKWN